MLPLPLVPSAKTLLSTSPRKCDISLYPDFYTSRTCLLFSVTVHVSPYLELNALMLFYLLASH
jgi:hypothetical protein